MDGHCARRRAEKEAGGRMDERAGVWMDTRVRGRANWNAGPRAWAYERVGARGANGRFVARRVQRRAILRTDEQIRAGMDGGVDKGAA